MGHLSIPLDGPARFYQDTLAADPVRVDQFLREQGGSGQMAHIDLAQNDGPVGALFFMPGSTEENDRARYVIATLTGVHVLIMGPAVLTEVDEATCIQAIEEYGS